MKPYQAWLIERFLTLWSWVKRNLLEIVAFGIALGSAEVWHYYLLETGSKDSWQLIVAVYATEILIVWSSAWGATGLGISTVLCSVSLISIHSMFKENWIGHSYFSIAIYCAAVGNFVRKYDWRKLPEPVRMVKGVYSNEELLSLSIIEIRDAFKVSFTIAKAMRQRAVDGLEVTKDFINELR